MACVVAFVRVGVLLCGVVSVVDLGSVTALCTLFCALIRDACVAWLRSLLHVYLMPKRSKASNAQKVNGAKASH